MSSASQGGKEAKTIKTALLVFVSSLKWIALPLAGAAILIGLAELALGIHYEFSQVGWAVLPEDQAARAGAIWLAVEIWFITTVSLGIVLSVSRVARPGDPVWWLFGLSDYIFLIWYVWCFARFDPSSARLIFVASVAIYYGPEFVVLKAT